MKKIRLTLLAISISSSAFSQNKIDTTGDVGIGTTSPGANLEISATADTELILRASGGNNNAFINFFESTGTNGIQIGQDGSANQFYIAGGNPAVTKHFVVERTSGNVGIGTPSPEAKLQVNGNLSILTGAERMIWSSKHEGASDHRNYFAPRTADNTGWDWGQEFGYHHYNRAWYFDGNVGIGTNGPDSKLEVRSSLSTDDQFETVAKFIGYRSSSNSQKPMLTLATQRGGNTPIEIGGIAAYYEGSAEGGIQILTKENGTLNPQLTINKSGSVGIGTQSMFGYRLAVNGTIGSTEVKVENTSPWPDFVFENNYELRTLEEVEEHISEKGHLPEIPSEAEVTKNGINLGEMDAKLLQKIEELTLYLIEQNKRLNTQQKEIEELKAKIKN